MTKIRPCHDWHKDSQVERELAVKAGRSFYQYNVNENGCRHLPHVQAKQPIILCLDMKVTFFYDSEKGGFREKGILRAHAQNNLG